MSNHSCPVVPVTLTAHPNADKLAMVNGILGGYNCGVSKSEFEGVTKAAFIPPDSLIPVDRECFQFLRGLAFKEGHPYAGLARVTVKRFRGVYSDGLLVKVPDDMEVGTDAAEFLGVQHYEPVNDPAWAGNHLSGDAEGIDGFGAKYDIENLKRYSTTFAPGEQVVVTEKIHGCNARYAFRDGRHWCGSRSHWKKAEPENVWWLAKTPEMEALLANHPDLVLFGEVYGKVQKGFLYDAPEGGQKFVAFDLWSASTNRWLEYAEFSELCRRYEIPTAPLLYEGPFDLTHMAQLSEGPSTMGVAPCREGVVVRSVPEKWNVSLGRHQLKMVGNGYLELKD